MVAINYNDNHNEAFCYITNSSTDLERYLIYIHRQDFRLVSVIPLNHLTAEEPPYFHVYYTTRSDNFVDKYTACVLHFWDLLKLRQSDKDIIFHRILPYR